MALPSLLSLKSQSMAISKPSATLKLRGPLGHPQGQRVPGPSSWGLQGTPEQCPPLAPGRDHGARCPQEEGQPLQSPGRLWFGLVSASYGRTCPVKLGTTWTHRAGLTSTDSQRKRLARGPAYLAWPEIDPRAHFLPAGPLAGQSPPSAPLVSNMGVGEPATGLCAHCAD